MYQSPETNLWILVIEFSALLVESKEKFFCKAEELHFYALRKSSSLREELSGFSPDRRKKPMLLDDFTQKCVKFKQDFF